MGDAFDLSLEFFLTGSNINKVTLGMGGKVDSGGEIKITDHVYDGVAVDESVQLLLITPSTSLTDLSDSTPSFSSSSALILDKDIFLNGPGEIAYVTQRAHRVPEPSGLSLLLVVGGIMLALRRREAAIRLLRRSIA